MAIINTEITYSKTLSFKEDVKGWVSFKSFTPEIANSMANDYYTFHLGRLYIHHDEGTERNTFYKNPYDLDGEFLESSVDVILNDNPSFVKEFNTLNYEGSQSKIDKYTSLSIGTQSQQEFFYDQEIYNLLDLPGWSVDSIITDKENGYINEFIEKEGKWFNYIKKQTDIGLEEAETADFSFQGIGMAEQTFILNGNNYVVITERYDTSDPSTRSLTEQPTEGEGEGEGEGKGEGEIETKKQTAATKTQAQAPPGFHYMPDGSLMADADMVEKNQTTSRTTY